MNRSDIAAIHGRVEDEHARALGGVDPHLGAATVPVRSDQIRYSGRSGSLQRISRMESPEAGRLRAHSRLQFL